ncbi:hypothetical protein BDN72DRAFT_840983 [Pluteus cervinus]|uniref:Uncharacterized protein n=1 Tax=Pluteus cervinus TaxID=181527 RepID=A0ACD3AU65_9AGAR|nr:hypothetical protein BDN72DRAFT_840983 [Pluteus cervinus]
MSWQPISSIQTSRLGFLFLAVAVAISSARTIPRDSTTVISGEEQAKSNAIEISNGMHHIGFLFCSPAATRLTTDANDTYLCTISDSPLLITNSTPRSSQPPTQFRAAPVPETPNAATFVADSDSGGDPARCLTQVNYQFGLEECEIRRVPQVFCFDGRRILLPPEAPVSSTLGSGDPGLDCQAIMEGPNNGTVDGGNFAMTFKSTQEGS